MRRPDPPAGRARTRVIAHRGASAAAPENTMAAFRLAHRVGADAIELDVHLTADRELAVIHDPDLDRTTDATGPVASLTIDEIRRADAGGGERVPTLAEVVDWLPADLGLVVEVKARAAAVVVAELLLASPIGARASVISFDEATIDEVRGLAPGIATGLLLAPGDSLHRGLAHVIERGHAAVHAWEGDLGADAVVRVALAAAAGKLLGCYVVDDPGRMRELAAAGLAGFVTNRPDVAREALDG